MLVLSDLRIWLFSLNCLFERFENMARFEKMTFESQLLVLSDLRIWRDLRICLTNSVSFLVGENKEFTKLLVLSDLRKW